MFPSIKHSIKLGVVSTILWFSFNQTGQKWTLRNVSLTGVYFYKTGKFQLVLLSTTCGSLLLLSINKKSLAIWFLTDSYYSYWYPFFPVVDDWHAKDSHSGWSCQIERIRRIGEKSNQRIFFNISLIISKYWANKFQNIL